MCIRASSAAHTKNEAPSTASAQPGFSATTRTPPSAGPTIRTPLRDRPCKALACCRRAGLTVCGTSPASAGTTSPSPSPHTTPSTANHGTVATPASTMAALATWAAPCTQRGADQHEVAPHPVRQHATEDQHRGARDLPGGEHDPQCRGTRDVEHRESQRDHSDRGPERCRQRRSEKQPVLALLQRPQPLAERSAQHAAHNAPSAPPSITPPAQAVRQAGRAAASAIGPRPSRCAASRPPAPAARA